MQVTDLQYAAADNSAIRCIVEEGDLTRIAVLQDDGSDSWYCKAYHNASGGAYGPIASYVRHEPVESQSRVRKVAFELALLTSGIYEVDAFVASLTKTLPPYDGGRLQILYKATPYSGTLIRTSEMFAPARIQSAGITAGMFDSVWNLALELSERT